MHVNPKADSSRLELIRDDRMNDSQHVKTITLPAMLQTAIEAYIFDSLLDQNPYTAAPQVAETAAHAFWKIISRAFKSDHAGASAVRDLHDIIVSANSGGQIPPMLIKNLAREPALSSVQPDQTRGFNYGFCEKDRMKKYFFTEWSSWAFSILLNHENAVHPSEHGGGNRFHLVSPISIADNKLRDVGASTGGGKFQQHSDATAYNEFSSEREILAQLRLFDATRESLEENLELPYETVISQLLCGKYIRVDATVLAGIYNKDTLTYIMLPEMLQQHLFDIGFGKEDLYRLSRMAIAHMAGPADGEISGYVGNIAPPLRLDNSGNIVSTCLNLADGRMRYVGSSEADKGLFARFVVEASQAPVEKILVEASDMLFLPNSAFGTQFNVTHGRGALRDSDYAIEIEPSIIVRRAHCRQYLTSRRRNGKAPFLQLMSSQYAI